MFNDVYVWPNDETTEHLYSLQQAASQLPSNTPIEDVIVPKDASLHILTETLDQTFGHRHGKVVRGMGKVWVRKTGTSSSKLTTGQAFKLSGLQISMPEPNPAPPSTSQTFHPADTQYLDASNPNDYLL
ncbi:hypothetical protein DVH24_001327 [Malus domestica]|uniref:Uncharacterized protein n=1 Tax=Malus domestica TaxID=3750 RepID=A0A498K5X4_MALDO|nr:hypothetical protein DVH24_001327 [Malus domestica]